MISRILFAQVADYKLIELVEEEVSLIDSWVQLTDNQLISITKIVNDYEQTLNGYYLKNNELKNFNKVTRKLNKDRNKKIKSVLSRQQFKLFVFFDKNRKKSSKQYVKDVYSAIKGHPKCQKELNTYHSKRVLPVFNSLGREITGDMTNEEIFKLDSVGTDLFTVVGSYYGNLLNKKKVDTNSPAIQDSLRKVIELVSDGTTSFKGIKAKYSEDLEPRLNAVTDHRQEWRTDYNEILSKYFQGSALDAITQEEEKVEKSGLNKELTEQTILLLKPGFADKYNEFYNQLKSLMLESEN